MNPAARLLVIFLVAGLVPSGVLGVGLLRGKARRGRRLGSLRPDASYNLISDRRGSLGPATGESLLRRLELTLPDRPQSDLIPYRRRPTDAPTTRPANP